MTHITDMATTAAQMASYLYPESEKPEDAFSWWLSPCGGSDLVSDDIKTVFDTLGNVADGVSSFKPPKTLPKGSGRHGDDGNLTDRGQPSTPGSGRGSNGNGGNGKGGNGKGGNGKGGETGYKIPASKQKERLPGQQHTYGEQECVQGKTVMTEWIITSVTYAPNAAATHISKPCEQDREQACW
jgi:hypothetical protein